jgi:hypothetical protein
VKRCELEHIIRAACDIADDDELIVIGSQSVLGRFPDAPSELLTSMEADVYPKNRPERAILIEGSIGELSMFHETFGYYADGVREDTATLPDGWKDRLVLVCNENTRNAKGWCLEPHDLVLSKYVAGRAKDRRFALDALAHGIVSAEVLLDRLKRTPIDDATQARIRQLLASDC